MGSSETVARLRDRGLTPGLKDVPAIAEVLETGSDEDAALAEKALYRLETANVAKAVPMLVARATKATRPGRGRLTRVLGRFAQTVAEARAFVLSVVRDDDPKTRRAAARALGKLPKADDVARALLDAWDHAPSEDDRRALAEPLGKLGSPEARERLALLAELADDATAKKAGRAVVMLEREAARAASTTIDPAKAMAEPVVVRFHTRVGLERVVESELGETWRPRVAAPGIVEARLDGPLAQALRIRTALEVGFPLEPVNAQGDLAAAIVRALSSERATHVFRTYQSSAAPARFRIAFAKKGHHRALVWRVAELVQARTKHLVNDPREATWEVLVEESDGLVTLEILPRGAPDDRFAYRKMLVPASSSPVIAAAIARVAPRRDDDVVWDPFVGAGAELVERARLGPVRRLFGTDLEPKAIEAATTNLAAADVKATLTIADATEFVPAERPTLVLTNPPMGRRVQRGTHVDVLGRFVEHVATVLAPEGALVLPVPEPAKLSDRASKAGLVLERAFTVDMGGFPAALSVFRKAAR